MRICILLASILLLSSCSRSGGGGSGGWMLPYSHCAVPAPRPHVMPISAQEFNAAGPLEAVGGGSDSSSVTTEYAGKDGNHYFETLYLENQIVVSVVYWKEVE